MMFTIFIFFAAIFTFVFIILAVTLGIRGYIKDRSLIREGQSLLSQDNPDPRLVKRVLGDLSKLTKDKEAKELVLKLTPLSSNIEISPLS